jgi:DNA polymerase III subunit beta
MKLTFTKEILTPALKKLGEALKTKSSLPVIENILVTCSKEGTEMTTTDLNITICYKFEIKSEEGDGSFLIPFNDLKKIVALEDGAIVIGEKKGHITIMTENDKFTIGKPGDVEDFPKVPSVSSKNMFSINGTFIPSLNMASLTAGKDGLRPTLTSILINVNPGQIDVVSTDGNQLYERTIGTDIGKAEQQELMVPPVVAKVLDGFTETKIGFNKSNACFESGPMVVYARRIDGKYPAYKSVIPPYTGNVKLNLSDLENALQKVAIVSNQDITEKVTFTFSDTELFLKSRCEDVDKSAETRIICESSTDTGEICFNATRLANALKQLRGHTTDGGDIEMSVTSPLKAVIFKVAGLSEVTVLLMPIIMN